jgi:ABC-type phosphate transport system substrate-binding protein
MNKFISFALLALLAVCLSTPVRAEQVVVIVHKDNPHSVDRQYVINIYTGATKGWPDGSPVFPLDQIEDSEARNLFYAQVVGRSPANMRALWTQNIFSGKGLPPKVASPDAEMRRIVATNRNAIGYIRASALDASVRAIIQ